MEKSKENKQIDRKFDFSTFDYFDTHTHFFPDSIFSAIWHYFEENYWPIHLKERPENLAKILTSEYNVKHFVILNYAHKKGMAHSLNNWTYNFCMSPILRKIALPFGTIHAADNDRILEMDRIFGDFGFAGIKLQLMVTNFHIWDNRLTQVFQKILEYERILVVHIGTGPTYSNFNPGTTLQSPYVGFKHLQQFMEKYPEMKVIVPHLGAEEYEKMWGLVQNFPNLYFDTAMIGVKDNPAFNDEMNLVNDEKLYAISDRILFGSDFPNIPYDFRNGVLGWLERGMERTFYEKLFSRNAERLFKDFI
ncbi:MAG: amidohydrolase family protein [Candidatus Hodarchaeales archaeon]|jgi:predicted TIM-barrel fold metal-dependent hydrolase